MAAKKRGLGKGLNALLGDVQIDESVEKLQTVPIEFVHGGRFQPRKTMDSGRLQELADSIRSQGIVQPVLVREIESGKYEIIAGERRWRAAQLAGMHEIPIIKKDIDDRSAVALALIENIQREDLNPLEEAGALQRLADEFEMTHQQVADIVGKSRVTVTNLLRLNDLHSDVKQMLVAGDIEMGHARALLGLDMNEQSAAASRVKTRGLTVRATEGMVKNLRANITPTAKKADPNIERLQNEISEKLGAQVQITHGRNGKGRLVIHYSNLEQLDGVLERIH